MAGHTVHDLSAAYALGALDADERAEFETHLGTCERCRDEVASLEETAAALAYAVPAPAPPPALRERVVEAARAERSNVERERVVEAAPEERSNVVALRPRRRLTYAFGAVAAAAAAVAITVGVWAAQLARDLDHERSVAAILADPDARSLPLEGATGRVVVTDDGEAALVVGALPPAPDGKTYEAWVLEGDAPPRPAGLFDGRADRDVVLLSRQVAPQAGVAVTIEPAGGSQAPTSKPIFSAGV